MPQPFPADLRILTPVATVFGAVGALEAINTTQLPDHAIVQVVSNNQQYQLRKTSAAAPVGDDIVAPAQGGLGRWFKYAGAAGATGATGGTGATGATGGTGATGSSGAGPTAISESASTGFFDSGGLGFVLKQNGGAEIECSFSAWEPNDILHVSYFGAVRGQPAAAPFSVTLVAQVSIDAGASWDNVAGSKRIEEGDATVNKLAVASDISAAINHTGTVLVRIQFQEVTASAIGVGSAGPDVENGITLRCEQYTAGSYTPAGSILP